MSPQGRPNGERAPRGAEDSSVSSRDVAPAAPVPARAGGRVIRFLLGTLAAAALVGVLVTLYARSSKVDTESKAQVEAYLRQMKQVDAEWNVDVLKSRMELDKNYDRLVSPLPVLVELQEKLVVQVRAMRQDAVGSRLRALADVIGEKTDLIEQFKAENAILKNSLRYIPTAVNELHTQISDARRGNPRQPERLGLIETQTNRVLNAVLRYNLFPDAGTAQTIEVALAELELMDWRDDGLVGASVENFVRHTRTILHQRTIENDVLARLLEMPVRDKIDELGQVFDRDFAAAVEETNRYRNYLVAYATLLLALLGYFGARLFRSYRIIARVNKELTHANETLEVRVRDRTEKLSQALDHLKESESQLVQSEKMASLGQMVAGVAHEINTPLAYVRSSVETVESHFNGLLCELIEEMVRLVTLMQNQEASEDEIGEQFAKVALLVEKHEAFAVSAEVKGLLKDGIHGIDEISNIVLNLRNFSRLERNHVGRCTVEECLDSTLQLARSVVAGKRVRKVFASTLPIRCSPSQINQVFLNLVTNAAQATAEDGVISVVTRMHDAQHVAVDVIDDGVGIPDEVRPKIFDPFFTTKSVGKGTGLGLSIVYKIVEQHGGRITVHSKEGVGTKFTVVLPVENAANADELLSAGDSASMAA